jgi:hypothetical protein
MIIPSPRGLPSLVLVILCAFSNVLNAYDLSQKKAALGPLGVTLDYSFATTWPTPINNRGPQVTRNWLWSSYIKFASPVSAISDAQLWQMARDAWIEIAADIVQYDIGRPHYPRAMTVMAYGNEIFLVSSQTGQTSYTYNVPNTPVLTSLQICQMVWRDDGPGGGTTDAEHMREGKCGETMAAHLYYSINNTPLKSQQARIGTVFTATRRAAALQNTPPCGDPQNVGGTTPSRSLAVELTDSRIFGVATYS